MLFKRVSAKGTLQWEPLEKRQGLRATWARELGSFVEISRSTRDEVRSGGPNYRSKGTGSLELKKRS